MSNRDSNSLGTSVFIDHKRTEPLITKAYNAFRQNKKVDVKSIVPTEAYLDDQKTFRETAMSGLKHAQKLMDSTQV